MIKRLLFIRHGQSTANEAGVYAGSSADIKLTPLGEKQAALAGEDLVGIAIDVIYASPLNRAQETATIIAGKINYPVANIITDSRIHEIDVGKLTGTPDHGFTLGYNHLARGEDKTAETPVEIMDRIADFLRDIFPANSDKTVLIVAHAGVARAISALASGQPLEAMNTENVPNAEAFDVPVDKLETELA